MRKLREMKQVSTGKRNELVGYQVGYFLGAFHSTKTFENLEIVANGRKMSRKHFQKFRKLLKLGNA